VTTPVYGGISGAGGNDVHDNEITKEKDDYWPGLSPCAVLCFAFLVGLVAVGAGIHFYVRGEQKSFYESIPTRVGYRMGEGTVKSLGADTSAGEERVGRQEEDVREEKVKEEEAKDEELGEEKVKEEEAKDEEVGEEKVKEEEAKDEELGEEDAKEEKAKDEVKVTEDEVREEEHSEDEEETEPANPES